jgi:hypothetical protein
MVRLYGSVYFDVPAFNAIFCSAFDPNIYYFKSSGECDITLIHVPAFAGADDLTVAVRTTIRYGYSFIETAAIRIGDDTLEVSGWGEYSFNGVENALINSRATLHDGKTNALPTIGGFPIFRTPSGISHSFDVMLSAHKNITIGTMKDLVSVKVHGTDESLFGSVEGFLGDFNGRMLARDGVTMLDDDIEALALEWQVRDDEPMLFSVTRSPQYPENCRLPDLEAKEARRLGEGINKEVAEAACAYLKQKNAGAFAACVYDVTATNDIDQAKSGAY